MDQRKVNMLAREYCDATSPKIKFKPIILSHRECADCDAPEWVCARARAGASSSASALAAVDEETN